MIDVAWIRIVFGILAASIGILTVCVTIAGIFIGLIMSKIKDVSKSMQDTIRCLTDTVCEQKKDLRGTIKDNVVRIQRIESEVSDIYRTMVTREEWNRCHKEISEMFCNQISELRKEFGEIRKKLIDKI